jgi:hypothetical protein
MDALTRSGTRVCGLATVMLMGVCALDLLAGTDLHLSVEMSLLLAAASFVVANLRSPQVAYSLMLSAGAIAAVAIVLHFYIIAASPTGQGIPVFKPYVLQSPWVLALDGVLAVAPIAGLVRLCLQTRAAAAPTPA